MQIGLVVTGIFLRVPAEDLLLYSPPFIYKVASTACLGAAAGTKFCYCEGLMRKNAEIAYLFHCGQ